jgi:hypothetical protein
LSGLRNTMSASSRVLRMGVPTCSARHAAASVRDETVASSASSPPAQVQRCCVPTVWRARYKAHDRAAATPPGRAIRDVVRLVVRHLPARGSVTRVVRRRRHHDRSHSDCYAIMSLSICDRCTRRR